MELGLKLRGHRVITAIFVLALAGCSIDAVHAFKMDASRTSPSSAAPSTTTSVVYFDASSFVLNNNMEVLSSVVSYLNEHPDTMAILNGYTSSLDTEDKDIIESQRRAQAVAHYLETQGINTRRIKINALGKMHFVSSNDTAEGRAKNDRVEIIVTP